MTASPRREEQQVRPTAAAPLAVADRLDEPAGHHRGDAREPEERRRAGS